MSEIPPWFYKAVALIAFWLIGQIVTEWLKLRMRKEVVKGEWTGNERRQTITVDEVLIAQILSSYQEHISLVRQMGEAIKTQNNLLVAFSSNFEEHSLEESKNRRMLRRLHDHFHLDEVAGST